MEFTYVGDWIEDHLMDATNERMIADITFIYEHPEEFENWQDLYNDGCDLYCFRTRKDRIDIMEEGLKLIANG